MKQKILEKIEYHQGLADKYKANYEQEKLYTSRELYWVAHRSNVLVVQALKELLEDE